MASAYRAGAARMAIGGENPALLSGQDPDRVARANRARSVAYRPALELITNFAINWSIVCCATPAWAALMFPDLEEDAAVSKLWDAIFAVMFNIGTLVRPTTRPQYLANPRFYTPPQLFSHSDQVTQWQTSIPDAPPTTGWAGPPPR